MDKKTKPPNRWSRSRPELEPCCDYILFEAIRPGHMDWKPVTAALHAFRQGILEQRVHRDPLAGCSQLLVKLSPHKGEHVRRAVLAMKPRPDLVIYFYNRPQAPTTPESVMAAGQRRT